MRPLGLRMFAWNYGYRKVDGRWTETYEDRIVRHKCRRATMTAAIDEGLADVAEEADRAGSCEDCDAPAAYCYCALLDDEWDLDYALSVPPFKFREAWRLG